MRAAILDGRLQPGSRLPPTRALAAAYGVSRNTAVAAYDLLLSEGYLATRPRAGAYVADVRPRSSSRGAAPSTAGTDSRLQAFWRRSRVPVHLHSAISTRFDFRLGVPDKRFFPFDVWRRLTARAIRSFAKKPAAYAEPQGLPALREAIAKHVSFARAVACRPEDIVVTAGSQQALRSPRPHPDLSGPHRGRRGKSSAIRHYTRPSPPPAPRSYPFKLTATGSPCSDCRPTRA